MKKTFGKKVTMGLFCAIMSASMLMGCSSASTEEAEVAAIEDVAVSTESVEEASSEVAVEKEAMTQMPAEDADHMEVRYMGEVSSVEDGTITVALYDMPDMAEEQGEKPADGMPEGEKPAGEAPEMEFTLSGEEMTLTITEETVITKRSGDTEETISLTDIAEGDVVSFTVDGENALTLVVNN